MIELTSDPPAAAQPLSRHEVEHILGRAPSSRLDLTRLPPALERLARHWLVRCFDVALVLTVAAGSLTSALALSHVVAVVLVVQAFLLDRPAALVRVLLAATATILAGLWQAVPLGDLGVQVPFVYGIAALVVLLADTVRRSHGSTIDALRDTERFALYDPLTGLPNRTLFADRVEHAIGSARRATASVALLLLDLDHFKEVNDTFGHHMGDGLLGAVGPRLLAELRDGDTLARLGGDEFGVLLPDAGAPVAIAIAERLIAALEQPFAIGGQALTVGTSVGIACSPEHALEGDTLLQRADIAMYVAKRSRGTYVTYDPVLDDASADRIALNAELAAALGTEQIRLYYQPQIDAFSGALVAVEALARWEHPRRGSLSPAAFVPLAERSGLMRRLTEQVLHLAARQAAGWRAVGRPISVAVNISTRDLRDPRLVDLVQKILRDNGLPASALTLEITESALMSDQDRVVETVARLREIGLAVSVDDYGSGYSSVAYLSRLAPDEVKIDHAFVSAMPVDRTAAAIVRATIELGRALGIRVVAEGIEDAALLVRLRDLGADRLQGYGIARPMPPGDVVGWTEAREAVTA